MLYMSQLKGIIVGKLLKSLFLNNRKETLRDMLLEEYNQQQYNNNVLFII